MVRWSLFGLASMLLSLSAAAELSAIGVSVNGMDLSGGSAGDSASPPATNVTAGVYLEWPVAVSAPAAATVKVSGLPSGLKFAAKPVTEKVTRGSGNAKVTVLVTNVPANTIYGVPRAASKTKTNRKTGEVTAVPSTVKVKVTTARRSVRTYQMATTVDPLPNWAVGTFNGAVSCGDAVGVASMTVAASGKISGRYSLCGTNWTFSAPGYSRFVAAEPETNRLLLVDAVAKSGKLTRGLHADVTPGWITNRIAYRFPDAWIMAEDAAAYADAHATVWPYRPPLIAYTQEVSRVECSRADGGDAGGAELVLHRNVWKGQKAGLIAISLFGDCLPTLTPCRNLVADAERYPDVKVNVSANGKVRSAGKLPDGARISSSTTAYLVPESEKPRFLLLAPTTRKHPGWLDELTCPSEEYLWFPIECADPSGANPIL